MKNLLKSILLPVFILLGSLSAQSQTVIKTQDGYALNKTPLTAIDLASIQKLLPNQNYLIVNGPTGKSYGTMTMDKAVQMSKTSVSQSRIKVWCSTSSVLNQCETHSLFFPSNALSKDIIVKLDQILLKYNNIDAR
jgi:hypothetical protein